MADIRTSEVDITRVTASACDAVRDTVVVEEPLEIIVAWESHGEPREKNISVTMRTPGDDEDLAAGFLFTERIIQSGAEIEHVRHWGSANRVRVALKSDARPDTSRLNRHFYTTSSCGVCGKGSLDAVRVGVTPLKRREAVDAAVVHSLAATLAAAQQSFEATGGVHGAALVDAQGSLLRAREDIGRHNAVDKVIGSFVRNGGVPEGSMLMVSSRGSFEIVQKAVAAQIGVVAFIGGPSSLAIDLAREFNVTLLGFVRDGRFNVYSGEVR
jgi:FdhD protein